MKSESFYVSPIFLDFKGIPPTGDENFPYEHAQAG